MSVKSEQDHRLAHLLRELAEDRGDSFRESYSGRGMFGASCVGIVTDEPTAVIEDAALLGVRHAKTDGMGRHTIVYWPHIPALTIDK